MKMALFMGIECGRKLHLEVLLRGRDSVFAVVGWRNSSARRRWLSLIGLGK